MVDDDYVPFLLGDGLSDPVPMEAAMAQTESQVTYMESEVTSFEESETCATEPDMKNVPNESDFLEDFEIMNCVDPQEEMK